MSSFSKMDFLVMALGNIIGSGIFLASSLVITIAGAWSPLAYLLGGLVMMMEVTFITEMAIANPVTGSFKVCAQEVFGDWWGFVNGWMFWSSGILGMASEIIACAIFTQLWLPHIPLWIFSLLFAVAITIINFNDLKGLSKIEFGLSFIKVITLILFIIIGTLILIGLPISHVNQNPVFSQLFAKNPWQNMTNLLGSMLLIFFAYTGTGIIGMAATETKDPAKIVPPVARIISLLIVSLYTLSAFFIVLLLPYELIDPKISPFVQLFTLFHIPYAGDIVNLILLSAALSALNSQVYSSSRMLLSLANSNQAPKIVKYQNHKKVPVIAVAISGTVLLITALLSYILPEKIFIYAISASGFLALVNWLSVSATQYYYRKKLLKISPEKLKYKSPGYPYLSWICFLSVLIAIFSIPLYPEQLPGLFSGCILLLIISIAYYIVRSIQKIK